MSKYPWLKPYEQPRMSEIFHEEVAVHPWAAKLDFMRLLATDTRIVERLDQQFLFSDALWEACFPVQPAGVYYHHTKLHRFRAILESGSIWLRPVSKYVCAFDEMTKFAEAFELDGYMERRSDGTRMIDELAEDLFILCLTSGPARGVHWDEFGPIRLALEVVPRFAEVELRKVAYALDHLNLPRHPLRILQRIAKERIERSLTAWKVSRMGPFYLPFVYKGEAETRLVVKQFPEGIPLPTIDVPEGKALPITIGGEDRFVQIWLRAVEVRRKSQLESVREVLDRCALSGVEVKVY